MEITLPELAERYYHLVQDVYIHAFTLVVFFDVLTGVAKAWVAKSCSLCDVYYRLPLLTIFRI